jgi:hypothetical protein
MLPMELENSESLLLVQRVLGQMLFYPPNVAGWPGGKTWIDSSTLMFRLRLPQLLNDNDELNVTGKTDDDQMGGEEMKNKTAKLNKAIKTDIDWNKYTSNFESIPKANLTNAIVDALFQVKTTLNAHTLKDYIDETDRDSFIRTITVQLMSTPEYQMC